MHAVFVELAKHFVSLIDEPHVLVVLGLTRIEYDDHSSVESLLPNRPADENRWMAVSKEEESLQQLDRTVDDQWTTTDWSLVMETVSTTRDGGRVCGTVDTGKGIGVRRGRCR
jgi:hypothetical protein